MNRFWPSLFLILSCHSAGVRISDWMLISEQIDKDKNTLKIYQSDSGRQLKISEIKFEEPMFALGFVVHFSKQNPDSGCELLKRINAKQTLLCRRDVLVWCDNSVIDIHGEWKNNDISIFTAERKCSSIPRFFLYHFTGVTDWQKADFQEHPAGLLPGNIFIIPLQETKGELLARWFASDESAENFLYSLTENKEFILEKWDDDQTGQTWQAITGKNEAEMIVFSRSENFIYGLRTPVTSKQAERIQIMGRLRLYLEGAWIR